MNVVSVSNQINTIGIELKEAFIVDLKAVLVQDKCNRTGKLQRRKHCFSVIVCFQPGKDKEL